MNGVKKESGFKFWDLLESNFLNGFPCLRIRNTFTKVCKTLSDPVLNLSFCFNYPFKNEVFLGVFQLPRLIIQSSPSRYLHVPFLGAQNTVFQAPTLFYSLFLNGFWSHLSYNPNLFVATHLSSYLECKLRRVDSASLFHHYDESSINIMTAT